MIGVWKKLENRDSAWKTQLFTAFHGVELEVSFWQPESLQFLSPKTCFFPFNLCGFPPTPPHPTPTPRKHTQKFII